MNLQRKLYVLDAVFRPVQRLADFVCRLFDG